MHHRRDIRRQVVEQGRDRVEEERQVILDARRGNAVGDVAVHPLARRVAFEDFAEPGPELGAASLVERELARRQETHVVDLVERALAVYVERADRFDRVVEKVDAVGQRAAHREEIDDAAADAVLAGRNDLRDMRVARGEQLRPERIGIEGLSSLEKEGIGGEISRRAEAVKRGRRRSERNVEFAALDLVERCETFGDEVVVRREIVVRECFPVRQEEDPQLRREPAHFLHQPLRVERSRADNGEGPAFGGQPRNGEGVTGPGEPG